MQFLLLPTTVLVAFAATFAVSTASPVSTPGEKGKGIAPREGSRQTIKFKLPPRPKKNTAESSRGVAQRETSRSTSVGVSRNDQREEQAIVFKAQPDKDQRRAVSTASSRPSIDLSKNAASSSGVKRPRSHRGAKGLAQWERLQKFERKWDELKLNTNMDPEQLADKVIEMRKHGLDSRSSANLAMKKVKAKNDPEYQNRYMARMTFLSSFLSKEQLRLKKDPYLSTTLDPITFKKTVLEESFKSAAKGERRKARLERTRDVLPLAATKEVAKSTERVGKLVEQHLAVKGYKLKDLPLDKIEEYTRDFKINDMKPGQVTGSLYRYVQHQRRVKEVDMARIKRARSRVRNKERKAKIARMGAAGEQEQDAA